MDGCLSREPLCRTDDRVSGWLGHDVPLDSRRAHRAAPIPLRTNFMHEPGRTATAATSSTGTGKKKAIRMRRIAKRVWFFFVVDHQ
jgi:hypothetical protein